MTIRTARDNAFALLVRCPVCAAGVGQRCRTSAGVTFHAHQDRVDRERTDRTRDTIRHPNEEDTQ